MACTKKQFRSLKNLDLPKSTYDEVKSLINQFGPFGLIDVPLNPGTSLIRARPHRDGVEEHFTHRSELRYKPQESNTTYQRASTPNRTMFYAGVIPDDLEGGKNFNARAVATLESSSLMRGAAIDGEQIITYSRWHVMKPFFLIGICYLEDLAQKTSQAKGMYETYKKGLEGLHPEMREKSKLITQFLADEFAKPNINTDQDYLISAVFSEMVVDAGKAGIYYPSVRAEGHGFNVAIAPDYADTHLKLVAAGECTIYREGKRTIVDNNSICVINDDTKHFTMAPVDASLHLGRDIAYARLRHSSFDND